MNEDVLKDVAGGIASAIRTEEVVSISSNKTTYRISFPLNGTDEMRILAYMKKHGGNEETFAEVFQQTKSDMLSKERSMAKKMNSELLALPGAMMMVAVFAVLILMVYMFFLPSKLSTNEAVIGTAGSLILVALLFWWFIKGKKRRLLKKAWKVNESVEKRLDNMIEISKKDVKELCKKEIICAAVILAIILIKGIMIIGGTMQ